MNASGTKLPPIELARIRISNQYRFSQQCFKLRNAALKPRTCVMMSVKKSIVGTSQFRNAAVSALAVCSFAALLMPVPAAADARLEATKTDRGGVIALEWPVPVKVETERDVKTRELLLRFDQPLGTVPFSRIQEVLGGMVETVEYGYDSMLIRVAPDVRVTLTNLASGVQIALSGAAGVATGASENHGASQ